MEQSRNSKKGIFSVFQPAKLSVKENNKAKGKIANFNPYITINHPFTNERITFGIEICRDHWHNVLEEFKEFKEKNTPVIQVVISDSVDFQKCYGDFMVHVDSEHQNTLIKGNNENCNITVNFENYEISPDSSVLLEENDLFEKSYSSNNDNEEYELKLMSELPEELIINAEKGKIYLNQDGMYILHNFKGEIFEDRIDTKFINLENLDKKINDPLLRNKILEVISKKGQTHNESNDSNEYSKENKEDSSIKLAFLDQLKKSLSNFHSNNPNSPLGKIKSSLQPDYHSNINTRNEILQTIKTQLPLYEKWYTRKSSDPLKIAQAHFMNGKNISMDHEKLKNCTKALEELFRKKNTSFFNFSNELDFSEDKTIRKKSK